MSTIALTQRPSVLRPSVVGRVTAAFSDTADVAGRNLRALSRTPQALIFAIVQPVIFVLLFRYAFGGAIHVPGVDYVDYLMPGIFAQAVCFGAIGTAVGLSADLRPASWSASARCPWPASRYLAAGRWPTWPATWSSSRS
jgi:hypothetical protein